MILMPFLVSAVFGLTVARAQSGLTTPRSVTILFVGDSLTAGHGVKKEEAFPELVGERLKSSPKLHGRALKIINGGISGSVSAEADRRLKWYVKAKPDILVLALGANDGLKGTPPEVVKRNLAAAIDLAKDHHVKVLLVGIRIFSNFGEEYTSRFEKIYAELAKEKKVAFMPFLLEGVALNRDLNQADGRHPNAKGHAVIAGNVATALEKLLE
jgi:acyl-CoA thioesterase-1